MKKAFQKKMVTDELIAFIEGESIGIGGRLPSERNLTEILDVSRNTVREALRELEARGRVKSKSGSGCFVTSHDDCANWVDLRGNTDPETLEDHMEAIIAIKPLVAFQAAECATEKEIKSLEQILILLSSAILNRDNTNIANAMAAFSTRMAEISGNRFYTLILQEMSLEKHIMASILTTCTDKNIQALFKNRVELINAFKNRNPKQAATLVKNSLERRHTFFKGQRR